MYKICTLQNYYYFCTITENGNIEVNFKLLETNVIKKKLKIPISGNFKPSR